MSYSCSPDFKRDLDTAGCVVKWLGRDDVWGGERVCPTFYLSSDWSNKSEGPNGEIGRASCRERV